MSDAESTAHAAAELASSIDPGARYQARIALITALVALVSALLGPLVSLKINSSQIESQREQTIEQNEVDRDASESEFVRTQRSAAYTDYLTAFNNATLDLIGVAGAFGSGASPQALSSQETTAIAAVKDVTANYYKVKIVASEDAAEKADALYAEFGTWSGALLQIGGKILNGVPLTATEQQLLDTTTDEYGVLLQLSNEFIESGRDDMASNAD